MFSTDSLTERASENLRRLVTEKYNTQQDFADDFGISLRTASRWINRNKALALSDIEELAVFFSVDPMYFLRPVNTE